MSENQEQVDVSRLDALITLKEDQAALRMLLEKAEARRDAEMAVYARVIADYQSRIAALADRIRNASGDAHDALRALEVLHESRRQAQIGRAHV